MSVITPPKYVKYVLMVLESHGCAAFLVGGCVRDMLLGRRPQDWDVCTDALPETVLQLFPRAVPTGLKHGTVTVKHGGGHVEVTTWRTESDYSDHRHPDSVRFIPDLAGDLQRRDFTMNAIALPLSGLFIDPFSGRADLERGLIRCVGEPDRRYGEDALRMFRALRFAARFGFDIETETFAAIGRCAPLAAFLAPERVRDELEKLICSPNPARAQDAFRLGLMEDYVLVSHSEPALAELEKLPKRPRLRWAGLCAILCAAGILSDPHAFLCALRLDSFTIRCCTAGVCAALESPPSDRLAWKRFLAANGADAALCCAAACDALRGSREVRFVSSILRSGECFSLKRLAVTGDDLLLLGLRGPELGRALHMLLGRVLEEPSLNQREGLLALARGMFPARNEKPE